MAGAMKRTRLDAGAKSRDRGSTFAAPRKQLERVSSLKSTTGGKGKGRKPKRDKEAERRFRHRVLDGPCLMCREFEVLPLAHRSVYGPQLRQLDAHHLIRQQTLRAEGLDEHVSDRRNGAPVCRYHHDRHHGHVERIPRSLLPAAVFEFAAELGLEAILDREYPATVRRVTNEREAA